MQKKYNFISISLVCFLLLWATPSSAQQKHYSPMPLNKNKTLSTIALGSCNNQAKPQVIWPYILKNEPDLWIWLGDIIYADTEDMKVMAAKYQKQKINPAYRFFLSKCPVVGIWDDHDYGCNDGDKSYAKKEDSKNLMLSFLDVPGDAAVRKHEGAYQTYTFGPLGKQVRVILLDTRYFRDALQKAPAGSPFRYIPDPKAKILGEQQWLWLENVLMTSKSDVHLIVSGKQIIPIEQGFEKWGNFPTERKRLLDLLSKICPANPILLTGDRHMAEVSEINLDGFNYPIKEITSSGLTHTWPMDRVERNKYRVGQKIVKKNFAVLKIDWEQKPLAFRVEIRGEENALYQDVDWKY